MILMETIKKNKERTISTERFELRLSPSDKKKLVEISKKANLTMTQVIIKAIDNIEIKESLSDNDRKMLYGLGKNLNQLIKFAHQGSFSESSILEIVHSIKTIINSRK